MTFNLLSKLEDVSGTCLISFYLKLTPEGKKYQFFIKRLLLSLIHILYHIIQYFVVCHADVKSFFFLFVYVCHVVEATGWIDFFFSLVFYRVIVW